MQKVLAYLEQLGFSKIEAKLYLVILQSGPMTVVDLAKALKINRTATYPYITSLLEKGILIETVKGSRKQLKVVEPDRLHYLIDNKVEEIKTIEKQFPIIVSSINVSLVKTGDNEQVEIKYYKGQNNAKSLHDEALKANEFRIFVKFIETDGIFSNNIVTFNEAFKRNKRLKVKEIIYNSPFAIKDAQELLKNKNYAYKLMPSDVNLDGNDILIYDNTVAIINYTNGTECIVLRSMSYYNNFKVLFDFMWNKLPKSRVS